MVESRSRIGGGGSFRIKIFSEFFSVWKRKITFAGDSFNFEKGTLIG